MAVSYEVKTFSIIIEVSIRLALDLICAKANFCKIKQKFQNFYRIGLAVRGSVDKFLREAER